jgi:hypothetical protein
MEASRSSSSPSFLHFIHDNVREPDDLFNAHIENTIDKLESRIFTIFRELKLEGVYSPEEIQNNPDIKEFKKLMNRVAAFLEKKETQNTQDLVKRYNFLTQTLHDIDHYHYLDDIPSIGAKEPQHSAPPTKLPQLPIDETPDSVRFFRNPDKKEVQKRFLKNKMNNGLLNSEGFTLLENLKYGPLHELYESTLKRQIQLAKQLPLDSELFRTLAESRMSPEVLEEIAVRIVSLSTIQLYADSPIDPNFPEKKILTHPEETLEFIKHAKAILDKGEYSSDYLIEDLIKFLLNTNPAHKNAISSILAKIKGVFPEYNIKGRFETIKEGESGIEDEFELLTVNQATKSLDLDLRYIPQIDFDLLRSLEGLNISRIVLNDKNKPPKSLTNIFPTAKFTTQKV